jgi:hypothetical protein
VIAGSAGSARDRRERVRPKGELSKKRHRKNRKFGTALNSIPYGLLSRKDLRTQLGPEAFGPGTHQHNGPPCPSAVVCGDVGRRRKGRKELLCMVRRSTADPESIIVPPLQGGTPFCPYLGLKPQAPSFYPFGISPKERPRSRPTDEQELIPTGAGC